MMKEKKVIRVDSWRPESRGELNELLAQGWEIVDVKNENHETCHNPAVGSDQTLFYELEKN